MPRHPINPSRYLPVTSSGASVKPWPIIESSRNPPHVADAPAGISQPFASAEPSGVIWRSRTAYPQITSRRPCTLAFRALASLYQRAPRCGLLTAVNRASPVLAGNSLRALADPVQVIEPCSFTRSRPTSGNRTRLLCCGGRRRQLPGLTPISRIPENTRSSVANLPDAFGDAPCFQGKTLSPFLVI